MVKIVDIERLTDELVDIHCRNCEGESFGCSGCSVRDEVLTVLHKFDASEKDT